MEIDNIFSEARWQETRAIYDEWWEQKINRPVVGLKVKNRTPNLAKPKHDLLAQANVHRLDISVDDVLDAIEYEVCSYEYIGDAYPSFNLDCFGPGITAAILGAELDNSTGNVWFKPKEIIEPDEMQFVFSEDNVWYKRIAEIMQKSVERFEGKIMLTMPDLSGVMDILASFRHGELLLYDLYDYPDETKKLNAEIFEHWKTLYNKFSNISKFDEFGYSDWASVLSTKPSYVIQSDFSYMIGEEMFGEFVLPNLQKFCDWLPRTLYHMDGPGEIKHLDMLLSLKKLDAIQWVPGAGNPTCENYPEIYEKVENSGKNIQIPGQGLEVMKKVMARLTHPERMNHTMISCTEAEKEFNIKLLKEMKVI